MMKLTQITPFVPVSDFEKSLAFFCDTLGFACTFRGPGYAFIRRDSVAIRLIAKAPDMDMSDPKRQQSCYIDVEDLDGLYASMKPKLDLLPEGRVRAPFNQDYGQREFHVTDEDALLVFFGEAINP